MSSETTATPGPWFATASDNRTPWDEETDMGGAYTLTSPTYDRPVWTVSTDEKYAGWCTDGGHYDYGVTEANARLMAAAPDLLAALEAVISVADRKTVEFDQARAAIAKAKGAQNV